jgi:hypothetical protein
VKTRPSLTCGEMKPEPTDDRGGAVCSGARHNAEQLNKEKCERVFHQSFNASAHP